MDSMSISRDRLEQLCDQTAGYEIIAHMTSIDPDSGAIDLVPRSRQEILSAVDAPERTIDRKLKKGVDEYNILYAESGERYPQYNDMRRVYRIIPGRIDRTILQEVIMKGYYRPRQPRTDVGYADIAGGRGDFFKLPEWSEFLDDYFK